MTTTALATVPMTVPNTGDYSTWSPSELALMAFAKVGTKIVTGSGQVIWQGAPRPVIEAFLSYIHRSGLDPIAKQIYCIEIAGTYTIVGAVDGMRLVATRTGQYEGQTAKEWTYDGITWTTIGASPKPGVLPVAARVGVWRKGFREALTVTISFDEFGKTPSRASDNWVVRPAWMLAIRAETHALRAAFPQELSGIYTQEDLDMIVVDAEADEELAVDWIAKIKACTDKQEMRELYREIGKSSANGSDAVKAEFDAHLMTLTFDSKPPAGAPGNTGEPLVDGSSEPASESTSTASATAGEVIEDAVIVPDDEPAPEPVKAELTEAEWEAQQQVEHDEFIAAQQAAPAARASGFNSSALR